MAISANRLELLQIADAVAREKVIDKQIVLDAMADAIAKAARSRYGAETDIHAEINSKTGELRLARHLLVVEDGAVENDSREITLAEARTRHNPAAQVGDVIADTLPPFDFGRIAAQSAKQVIVQKVRDAERDRQYEEYKDRIGEIVNGSVKRVEYGNVIVDLGRGEAIIRRDELIPRETFRPATASAPISSTCAAKPRGPQIFLSRTHPQFMAKLFASEVPEIYDGIVTVQAVARDPGLPRQDRRDLARFLDRPGRRLRRHARLARPGGGRRAPGREDRHHPLVAAIRRPSSSTRCSRRKWPRWCSTRRPTASRWWCPTTSSRSPSAAAARTCVWPRSSPAGTSTSSPRPKNPSAARRNSPSAPSCS